jgi:hypothetical protein
MKNIHMLLVSVALATMTIIGWANNAYAQAGSYASRGVEFEISGKHITNCKYFTQGQVVSLSGLYRADRKGVVCVEIQHRKNEYCKWTTVDKLDVAYDNEVHEQVLTKGRKSRGIRHKHEIEIANSGEYRIRYNGDSDLTVYCTDIRFE